MARHDIRGLKLSDGTYAFTSKDVYNLNDNFIQLSQEVFGNSNFSKNMDKRIKKAENDINAITTTVGDIESEYSQIVQSVDNITLTVADLNANTSAQIQVLNDEITSKVTQQDVQNMIDEINRANPNLVSNLPEKWQQGDIDNVDGTLVESANCIRTALFYPIRQGHVYVKVSPLYETKIVIYDSDYTYSASYGFQNEQTFLLAANSYFKVVVKRISGSGITPDAMSTAELKVENSNEPTQYTPYYGDLTLEEQQEYFVLDISSNNGWTVDEPNFSATLTARVYLFNQDVTMRFEPMQFTWFKRYADGQLISLGNGTTKIITGASLEKSATISCAFEIYDSIYTLVTFDNKTILTMDNKEIMVIGYQ